MKKNQKILIWLYVGLACLTLAIQVPVRLTQCAGISGCAVSLGKGVVWSGVWPGYWPIHAYRWMTRKPVVEQVAAVVDEQWYLSQYPDVRSAVQDGRFKSAQDHYEKNGLKEKRLPARPEVNEQYYLRANPDVAAAVKSGTIKSAFEHYVLFGHSEGRKPSP